MALPDPSGYPGELAAETVLADGGAVLLRPIRPDDGDRLRRFHARQSPESIYLRYFSPHPNLSDAEVRRFTHVDYVDRMAFVALAADEIVGVGRYERIGSEPRAEVAFIVDDAHHGRGLATKLLERLVEAARPRGITTFEATVLPENRSMLHVFAAAGFNAHPAFADGVIEVVLGL